MYWAGVLAPLHSAALAQSPPPTETRQILGQTIAGIHVPQTCNSVVFSQLPNQRDYFLGRRGTASGNCADFNPESLALFKMDWNTRTLNFENYVLKPPYEVAGPGRSVAVRSAYDPSVVSFGGELWVAFECAAEGYIGASTCVGPFDPAGGQIDVSRASLVVAAGDANPSSAYSYAASVPNLVVFGNRLYVYWSAIQLTKAPPRAWQRIAVRGMELVRETGGRARMWGINSGGRPVASYDPARNIEVLSPNPADPTANQTADLKAAFVAGSQIYMIVSVGGRGADSRDTCLTPKGTSPGCFRMQIFRSSTPLGADVFRSRLVAPAPPINAVDYQRPAFGPDGRLWIIGSVFNPRSASEPNALYFAAPSALVMYLLNLSSLRFSP